MTKRLEQQVIDAANECGRASDKRAAKAAYDLAMRNLRAAREEEKRIKTLADVLAMKRVDINTCKLIAAVCADANPHFDWREFLIACGYE